MLIFSVAMESDASSDEEPQPLSVMKRPIESRCEGVYWIGNHWRFLGTDSQWANWADWRQQGQIQVGEDNELQIRIPGKAPYILDGAKRVRERKKLHDGYISLLVSVQKDEFPTFINCYS